MERYNGDASISVFGVDDKTPSLHLPRTLDRDATIRMSALQTRAPSEVKSSPVARNRSLREYKVPPGPRIPDQDFTKRFTTRVAPLSTTSRPQNSNLTSEPYLGLAARRRASNYDALSSSSYRMDSTREVKTRDPAPPTNFDIMHGNLVPHELAPSRVYSQNATTFYSAGSAGFHRRMDPQQPQQLPNPPIMRYSAERNTSTQESVSPVTVRNAALRAAVSAATVTRPPVNSSQMAQRQVNPSTTAPGASKDIARPRKPVTVTSSNNQKAGLAMPSNADRLSRANSSWYDPNYRSPKVPQQPSSTSDHITAIENHTTFVPSPAMYDGSSNAARAQVLQEASRQLEMLSESAYKAWNDTHFGDGYNAIGLLSSDTITKHNPPAAGGSGIDKPPTPSAHFGNLGTRTISPTDVRRLKRKSLAVMPARPRSPTPELTFGSRPGSGLPDVHHGDGLTLSSSSVRRMNSTHRAGPSLSSTSSHGSQHGSNNSIQRRASVDIWLHKNGSAEMQSTSRGGDTVIEIVPPVPAIPKVYESPPELKDQILPAQANESPSNMKPRPEYNVPTKGSEVNFSTKTFRRAATVTGPALTKAISETRATATPKRAEMSTSNNIRPSVGPAPTLSKTATSQKTSTQVAPPSQEIPQHRDTRSSRAIDQNLTKPVPSMQTQTSLKNSAHIQPAPIMRDLSLHLGPQASARVSKLFKPNLPQTLAISSATSSSKPLSHITSRTQTSHMTLPAPEVIAVQLTQSVPLPFQTPELVHQKDVHVNTATSKPRPVTIDAQPSKPSAGLTLSQTVALSGSTLRRKLSLGRRTSSTKNSPALNTNAESGTIVTPTLPLPQTPVEPPRSRRSKSPTWGGILRQNLEAVLSEPSMQMSEILPGLNDLQKAPHGLSPHTSAVAAGYMKALPPRPLASSKSSSSLLVSASKRLPASQRTVPPAKTAVRYSLKLDVEDLAAEDEMRKLVSKRREFESAAIEVDELRRRASAKDRMSPSQALRSGMLNLYERGEIIDFQDIYFCGSQGTKRAVGAADLVSQSTNYGYDDDRGDYIITGGDHLAYRYEIVDVLGKGSFGQVVRCVDHKSGKLVAIKIIRNKKRFHQQALVEVGILQRLREWDPSNEFSMVNFMQSFYFRGHLCISTELLSMNLYEFIKAHEFRGFTLKIIRRFARQMLGSLCLLQSRNVIHCDLKPENILLAHPLHTEIKTIDFGSSCFEKEKVYTYIQSRFYRSPEVILGMDYGMPIDMWSLGCILAELLTGYPLFPGENEQEQLACIMEVFGPPEKHLVEASTRKKLFFDSGGKPRVTVSPKGKRRRTSSKTLQQAIRCDDEAFLDFLQRCLRWDPERRLKPDEAMAHEFITGIKKPLARARTSAAATGRSSPMKRSSTTTQTPLRNRPLPDLPPGSAAKKVNSASPVKSVNAVRRHSGSNTALVAAPVKKTVIGNTVAAALPSGTQRSSSGKPDLASAAAIASLRAPR